MPQFDNDLEARFTRATKLMNEEESWADASKAMSLMYYKYYMQAKHGDELTERPALPLKMRGKPGALAEVKEFQQTTDKWDAWHSVEGTTPMTAERKYMELLTLHYPAWDEPHRAEVRLKQAADEAESSSSDEGVS